MCRSCENVCVEVNLQMHVNDSLHPGLLALKCGYLLSVLARCSCGVHESLYLPALRIFMFVGCLRLTLQTVEEFMSTKGLLMERDLTESEVLRYEGDRAFHLQKYVSVCLS